MTAIRIIDDHIELANIGTKTHAEIEGHIQGIGNYAFPSVDGGADQILKSNGAGVLGWIDPLAGFACGDLNACNLSDIGTRPHSQLTNIGASDHHVKYTDAEAVAAADASDKFLERNADNIMANSPVTTLIGNTEYLQFKRITSSFLLLQTLMKYVGESTTQTYQNMLAAVSFPIVQLKGTDTTKSIGEFYFVKHNGANNSYVSIYVANTSGNKVEAIRLEHDKVDVLNFPIKDIKNHPHSALSGTKKLIQILIRSTPYYFEVYPTKA